MTDKKDPKDQIIQELNKEIKNWEHMFYSLETATMILGPELEVMKANKAMLKLLDKPLDAVIGKACYEVVHQSDIPIDTCPIEKMKKTNKRAQIELYMPSKDMFMMISVDPCFDDKKNITQIIHSMSDITDLIKTREQINLQKIRFESFLEHFNVMIVAIDSDEKVSLVNKKSSEVLGYSKKELIGKNWFDNFIPERLRDEVRSVFRKIMCGQMREVEYYENPVLTKSNKERLIKWHNSYLRDENGNIATTLGSGEDIAEHKKIERDLSVSERNYRVLFEDTPDGIIVADMETGKYVHVNPAICKKLGYTEQEIKDLSMAKIHPKEEQGRIKKLFYAQAKGEISIAEEVPFLKKDGTITYFDVNSVHIEFDGVRRVVGLLRDITERKQTEEESRKRIKDLERFHKVAVDRELKMIELKKEIATLKAQLNDGSGGKRK